MARMSTPATAAPNVNTPERSHARLRVAVVGVGWWAIDNHLPALTSREDVRVVAICRRDPDRLASIARQFDIPVAVREISDLPWADLDAAVVSSTHTLHHRHAAECLSHGLDVMCEKPLAVTGADAFDLVALAQQTRRVLLVPHGWQFAPAVVQARDWIQKGRVGRVEHVAAIMASPARALFSGEPNAIFDATSQPEPATWTGPHGGYAYGQMSHLLSLVFWLTRLVPTNITAMVNEGPAGSDLYDAFVIRCDGGPLISVSGGAAVPSRRRHNMEVRVYGSEGMLTVDMERDRVEVVREDGRDDAIVLDAGALRYDGMRPVHAFCELAQGRHTTNLGDPLASAYGVATIEAALSSARTGRVTIVPGPSATTPRGESRPPQ
jgi:predicted dehydrogenase